MLQSHLFTKTQKEPPRDETSVNARLLIQAGFVHKEMAGVYSYLPLGRRVLGNIVSLIRKEMKALGGEEVELTALQDPDVWKITDRWDDEKVDIWFKSHLNAAGEIGFATTHEEPLTRLMTHHISSYQDLPQYVFQFQHKFRNELRAKSGIMRGREFLMKDLYSFNASEESFRTFYEACAEAYMRIFNRCGIGDRTFRTYASGGSFSNFSDEFQTITDAGEDTIYVCREKNIAINEEVYTKETLTTLGITEEMLTKKRAVEVGNIFPLGTKFSQPLGLTFKDVEGEEKPVIMGSYGIGPGRVMGVVAELFADGKGLVWPEEIAPFRVHILVLSKEVTAQRQVDELTEQLEARGIEPLIDDRDVRPGVKFADSDLIGIPWRVVISDSTVKDDVIEVRRRNEEKEQHVSIADALGIMGV